MTNWRSSLSTLSKVLIFAALIGLPALLFIGSRERSASHAEPPLAVQGVLDLTEWDFEQHGVVDLKGEWAFYWGQLATFEDFVNGTHVDGQYVQVPNVWTNYKENGKNYPGMGYATYRLTVKTGGGAQALSLKIPDMSTSCKIMVDDQTIAACGKVAERAEEAEARYAPQVANFQTDAREFDIIVHVSNYLYDRGGMWYSMVLGTEQQIAGLRENEMATGLVLLGVFFLWACTISHCSSCAHAKRWRCILRSAV